MSSLTWFFSLITTQSGKLQRLPSYKSGHDEHDSDLPTYSRVQEGYGRITWKRPNTMRGRYFWYLIVAKPVSNQFKFQRVIRPYPSSLSLLCCNSAWLMTHWTNIDGSVDLNDKLEESDRVRIQQLVTETLEALQETTTVSNKLPPGLSPLVLGRFVTIAIFVSLPQSFI